MQLFRRAEEAGPDAVAAANAAPDDVAAQTRAADFLLGTGQVDESFGRLLDVVRRTAGADRDLARTHLVELFGVRWDLSDIAVYAQRFRAPHSGSLDDEKSWHDLCALLEHLPA